MRKSLGMIRKMDDLGRVVLPIELRRTLDWNEYDPIEVFVDGEEVILRKYQPGCIFCGNVEDLVQFSDKLVCGSCKAALTK